jgi:hypothetical protein
MTEDQLVRWLYVLLAAMVGGTAGLLLLWWFEWMTGKNRIMIYGPKDGGTYVVEFMTAEGDVLAISIPRTETHVIRHPGADVLRAVRAGYCCRYAR